MEVQKRKKRAIVSREYLLNVGEVILFCIKVLDVLKEAKREDEPIYADYLQDLGIAYRNKLDYDKAIEVYKKAIKIYEQNQMQDHPDYALCQMNLGVAYDKMGKKEEAVSSLELALGIFKQRLGTDHPYYQKCLKNIKRIKRELKDERFKRKDKERSCYWGQTLIIYRIH